MKDFKHQLEDKVKASLKLWVEICSKHNIVMVTKEESGSIKLVPENEEEANNRQFGANGVPADNWYTLAKIEFEKRIKKL